MPNYLEIPTTGGVNLLDDPRRIRDDELVRAKNLVPYTKGMLRKRPAKQPVLNGARLYGAPVIAGFLCPFPGFDLVTVQHGNSGGTSDADTVLEFQQFSGTSDPTNRESIAYANVLGDRAPTSFYYNGTLYILWGPGPASYTGVRFTATDIDSFSTGVATASAHTFSFNGTNNAFSPAVACVYRGRAVYGNFGPGYEHSIVFSDPFAPLTIGDDVRAANGRSFTVGPNDGDRIVAIVEITPSDIGSPAESALLVLKEFSAYIITGEPNLTTDTSADLLNDLNVSRISYDCGCSSPSTVVNTPYGLFWASWDDVWFFARGSLPKRVGSKIRPVLQSTPKSMRHCWQGAYYNGFYRLAVFSPGQGPGWGSTLQGAGTLGEQWWLDLRDEVPNTYVEAKWWGPQIFKGMYSNTEFVEQAGTGIFLARPHSGPDEFLYSIDTYVASITARESVLSTYDQSGARDLSALPKWMEVNTGNTTEEAHYDLCSGNIEFELISKEYDFGARMNHKGFNYLHADYWTSITEYLRMETVVSGNESTDTTSALCEQGGLLLDTDSVETAITRKFQETALYPTTRVTGKTFQFKIYDTAGYVVGASNNTLIVLRSGTYYAVTLTEGYYADLKALLDHLVARVLTVAGVSCSHNVAGPTTYATATYRPATITLTFGSAVTLNFQTAGGSITSAQLRKARALMGMLGWDTSANSSSGTGQTSAQTAYYKRTANWEFGGFEVEYDIFNRGPA